MVVALPRIPRRFSCPGGPSAHLFHGRGEAGDVTRGRSVGDGGVGKRLAEFRVADEPPVAATQPVVGGDAARDHSDGAPELTCSELRVEVVG